MDCMICLEKQNVKNKSLDCGCRISVHTKCHTEWNALHPNQCILCRRNNNITVRAPVQDTNPRLRAPVQDTDERVRQVSSIKRKLYLGIVIFLTVILVAVMII